MNEIVWPYAIQVYNNLAPMLTWSIVCTRFEFIAVILQVAVGFCRLQQSQYSI